MSSGVEFAGRVTKHYINRMEATVTPKDFRGLKMVRKNTKVDTYVLHPAGLETGEHSALFFR